MAAADAMLPQEAGDLVGAARQRGEGELGQPAVLAQDLQRRTVIAGRHAVEMIERPVEAAELRPAKVASRRGAVLAMAQQEVARRQELVDRRHGRPLPMRPSDAGGLSSGRPGSHNGDGSSLLSSPGSIRQSRDAARWMPGSSPGMTMWGGLRTTGTAPLSCHCRLDPAIHAAANQTPGLGHGRA
ncbi:MAG: hypothetical protein U1E53_32645 [Dongiaceae bacterium]